jgi:glucose dehydrogenase
MVTLSRRSAPRWTALVAVLAVAVALQTAPASQAAATCGPTAGVTGGEWRSYGHDLSNTRHQDKEFTIGLTDVPSLSVAWMHDSGAAYNNTPIVADGCVYLAASNGAVTAHNAVRWWRRRVAGGGR